MTAREMQQSFERKVTLIDPRLKTEKLTSDIIFSFLNAYTERYVKLCVLSNDQIQSDTRAHKKNDDAVKSLITRKLIDISPKDNNNTDLYTDRIELPLDYFLYIRSNSLLTLNYKTPVEITDGPYIVTPNKLIREDDVDDVMPTYYNKAIILNPYALLSSSNKDELIKTNYLNVIHDLYTKVKSIDLVYCRKPKQFDVIDVDGVEVLNYCELPDDVHMEIVEGAVEMFITEARFRLNTKQDK